MAQGEDLALLGADMDLFDQLPAGSVGNFEERRYVLMPMARCATGSKNGAVRTEDRSAAQVRRHLGQVGERALGGIARYNPGRGIVGHLGQNTGPVSLARASWITVVVICAIAAILFAISGYTGYTVTVIAVGLAAAVNLLPGP